MTAHMAAALVRDDIDWPPLGLRHLGYTGPDRPGAPREPLPHSYRRAGADDDWTPEADALLGTDSDVAVGRLLGRPAHQVQLRRLRLGVPASYERRAWTEDEDAVLGTCSDAEAARRLGRGTEACRLRRLRLRSRGQIARAHAQWTDDEDAVLGTCSDSDAALRLGRSVPSVRARRQRLGRPIWRAP